MTLFIIIDVSHFIFYHHFYLKSIIVKNIANKVYLCYDKRKLAGGQDEKGKQR